MDRDASMDGLLPIGRVARLSGLTVEALRHYDRVGVLPPAAVDPANGYRRYRPDQVADAIRIRTLRDLDVPLPEIRRMVAAPEEEVRRMLELYRGRVQARACRDHGILHQLSHLIGGEGVMTTTFDLSPEEHRRLGSALFNQVWTQLETEVRTQGQDERVLHMAHASRFHWGESQPPPENLARGEWQVSRLYAVLARAEPALHHAKRCLEICEANGIGDFDLAYAHEAMARAYAVGSDEAGARRHSALARDAGTRVGEDEDRELFEADLATLPVG